MGAEVRVKGGVAARTLDPEPINFLTPWVWMERQTGAFLSVLSR